VQALFRDRFLGVVRRGHPLATEHEVTTDQYTAFGLVQHRFCKFVAAGLRGCVGRSDEGA
jgi:DNA-binding transcriptional LysR family regulator